MKSFNYMILVVGMAAIISVLAPQAQAELLFGYDFNDLNPVTDGTKNLAGQKGWQLMSARDSSWTGNGLQAFQSPTPLVNDTIVVKNPSGSTSPAGNWKSIAPISFSAADTAVEQYVQLMVDQSGTGKYTGTLYGGFLFSNSRLGYTAQIANYRVGNNITDHLTSGEQRFYCVPNNYALDATSTNRKVYVSTEKATLGHWYEFKGVMDFSYFDSASNTYGQYSWSRKDLTAGETKFSPITFSRYVVVPSWAYDGADVTSVPMGLTPVDGKYTIDGISMFTLKNGSAENMFADNFSLGAPIPEPSTFALLACGLIGLLAYAWRKRK